MIVAGWNTPGLPAGSLGYVFLPGLIGVAIMTMLIAPLGARTAHRLPVKKLKRAFGGFLALMGTKMLHDLLG